LAWEYVGYLRHTTRALAIIGHESPYFSMKTGVFRAKTLEILAIFQISGKSWEYFGRSWEHNILWLYLSYNAICCVLGAPDRPKPTPIAQFRLSLTHISPQIFIDFHEFPCHP